MTVLGEQPSSWFRAGSKFHTPDAAALAVVVGGRTAVPLSELATRSCSHRGVNGRTSATLTRTGRGILATLFGQNTLRHNVRHRRLHLVSETGDNVRVFS